MMDGQVQNQYQQSNDVLCKLFVGNVNKTTTEEEFRNYFGRFGRMKEVTLMKDNNNQTNNRGFGFVTTEEVTVADQILLEQSHQLDGRDLDIKRALPKDIDDPLLHTRTTRVFLGGLPHNLTEEDLTNFFNEKYGNFGQVKEVVIKKERQTGRPRGFCFISFDNAHVVDKIMVELRYPVIHNKRCEVKKADPGIPITGAPPSQIPKVGGGRSAPPASSPYPQQRSSYPKGMSPSINSGPNSGPGPAYDYNSYGSGSGMVGYPNANAYYGYYQNQGVGSQYQGQPGPTQYPPYGYQDQRNLRSNYQRPQNSMGATRGRPY